MKLVIKDLKTGPTPDERTLYTLNSQGVGKRWQYKFGIVLLPSQGPHHLLKQAIPLESIIEDDPFRNRVKDDIHFTLYLTVPSGGSSGESAAWISRNWHLLHYLSELRKSSEKQRIKWLDLTGELAENCVRLQRFRLVGNQKPKRLSRRRLEHLKHLADEIEFHDLSNSLNEYFFSDATTGITQLEAQIRESIQQEEKSIIVIDGWSQLRNIIPSHLDSLLKTLEHRIIEWLPKKSVEIIWLDRPVPVPILSATYQLYRMTPVPHDSPRRSLLDEVLWNLPTSPRNFGWRTPRREDIRVIAQDTPTSNEPMMQSFGVPHLKGWARRFRADSKKERTVSPEEVFGDSETYGRAFYSASYVKVGLDSGKIILDDIYKLVPSLSRVRETQKVSSDEPPQDTHKSEHKMRIKALGKTTSSRGIWDRVSFIQEHQGPSLGRPGTYSSIEDITRGKVRKPSRNIPAIKRMSRRPPVIRPTPVEKIDTKQTRHDEVLRIQRTAEFLLKRCDRYDASLHGVLKNTIQLCKKYQRGTSTTLDTFDLLQKLYGKLECSRDLWKDLSYERIFGRGREQVPRSIFPVVRKQPEILTRYGIPLFLLLLGAMREVNSESLKVHVPTLWSGRDWQWVHMGFMPRVERQGLAQHRFDIAALWSNLLWRTRQLLTGPVKSRLFESHRVGEQIPRGDDQLWLVFQEEPGSDKMITGLLTGVNLTNPLRGTYKTIVDLGVLGKDAEYTLQDTSVERQTIIITRFDEMDLLWVKNLEEIDGLQWNLLGKIRYRASKEGMTAPIRGVTISGVPKKVIERIPLPDDVAISSDLRERVEECLKQIVSDAELVQSVRINVTINEESGSYLIHLVGRNEELLEELEYETTEEVIGVLRSPMTRGDYYQTEDGRLYSWNPLKDVSYDDAVETTNGLLSMTFLRPRVENEGFLNGTYVLPRTAREVIESELGEKVVMVATPDLVRYRKGWKRCWNVWFNKIDLGEGMRSMEQVSCTIYDIALLFECKQIFDVDMKKRHPTWTSINHRDEVEIPEELIHRSRMGQHLELRDLAKKDGVIYKL